MSEYILTVKTPYLTALKQKDDQLFSADRKVKRAEFEAQLEILLKNLKSELKTIANTAKVQQSAELDKMKTNIKAVEQMARSQEKQDA